MTFSEEDISKLRRLCQEIICNPRPIEDQPHKKKGVDRWCEDWEMIEILKYYFLGAGTYLMEPPPNRLKQNSLWTKTEILKKATELIEKHGTVDKIVEKFREKRNASRVS